MAALYRLEKGHVSPELIFIITHIQNKIYKQRISDKNRISYDQRNLFITENDNIQRYNNNKNTQYHHRTCIMDCLYMQ